MKMFRLLKADEIECRISQINEKGLTLLLYKDARADMNLLDDTVGPMNWKREHGRDNANCVVSIWDKEKQMWVSKEDTGTESNTEKEKGIASDSFKRACFNWGLGRELYSAPFIWISAKDCNIKERNGRYYCNDGFRVVKIEYQGESISTLIICNEKTRSNVYQWFTDKIPEREPDDPTPAPTARNEKKTETAELVCAGCKTKLTQKVYDFSVNKYGAPLCMDCQRTAAQLQKK